MIEIRELTRDEEIVNTVSHGVGICLAVPAFILLVKYARSYGDLWHLISFTVFGATLVMLYTASTLYHGFPKGELKRKLKIFDHACVYLLIAGTYTPITLLALRNTLGITILSIVWLAAVTGIIVKIFYINRNVVLSTLVYVGLGGLILVAIKPLLAALSSTSFRLLVLGGIFYAVGTIFFALQKIKHNHGIWHLFVLAGSICHFFTVLYLLPNFSG
ncbi:MAG: hemolysin III family protein [Firmicutes bacterium]|jgi:hemolysin III|nr:hemolysin III family protein [Bacillota bacterium]